MNDLQGLAITVLLGAAVLAGAILGPRLRIPVPPALLIIGVLLGFVPGLRSIELPPDVVLLLFLPVLLFWESLTASLRSVLRDLRGIIVLSTLLPVATAFAAAGIATALGMPWAAALILGAAVAPPDATAVGALGRSLPRRNFAVLKAESLTNDGTALVVYAVAVGAATGATYTPLSITGLVAVSYLGGIAAGAITAVAGYFLLRRLPDGLLNNIALLLVPFTAYLLAEAVGASGVLAVVVAGLALAFQHDRITTPSSRRMTEDAWPIGTNILNGALFVLIGLQVQEVVRRFEPAEIGRLLIVTVAVWVGLLVIRFLFQMVTVTLIRLLDRRPSQKQRRMPHTARIVSAVAGFRGAVSLAIALSVPTSLRLGPLGDRDAIVFVTAGVIVLTLVVQGPLLPAVTRWAHLPAGPDSKVETDEAEQAITSTAMQQLPGLADQLQVDTGVQDRIRHELDAVTDHVRHHDHGGGDRQAAQLRLAVIGRKRQELARLRRTGQIDDEIARGVQNRLDLQELALTGVDVGE